MNFETLFILMFQKYFIFVPNKMIQIGKLYRLFKHKRFKLNCSS